MLLSELPGSVRSVRASRQTRGSINVSQNTIEEIHTDIPEEQDFINSITYRRFPEILALMPGISKEAVDYFGTLSRENIGKAYDEGHSTITYEFLKEMNGVPAWVSFELHTMPDRSPSITITFSSSPAN